MRHLTRAWLFMAMIAGVSAPAAAQPSEGLQFRPFVLATAQRFAADTTFDAAFGEHVQSFVGGGLNITQDGRFYLELSASKFEKTGERAFFDQGNIYRLGIPVTAKITPFEISAGYRFMRWPHALPYLGAGVGVYRYKETSDFAVEGDTVDTNHAGGILEGGVEFRLHRWFGVAADVHYTYVPGILGDAGISDQANEKDLGGVAARIKVIVGR